MTASTSIAQEFYKLRDAWSAVDQKKNWRLAIWLAEYQDVDIIDKFLETERSPIGVFDDIFFRFDTEFTPDPEVYEKALWQEFLEWFEPVSRPEYDIYTALKNEGLLKEEYRPDTRLAPCMKSIWQELLRFRSCIKGMEDASFCIYFPPIRPEGPSTGSWYARILEEGIPQGIRLVTIDYAAERKLLLPSKKLEAATVQLQPKLDMVAAIKNEMDKGGGNSDAVSPDAQYRKQIRKVMDCTLQKNTPAMDREVGTLLSLSKQMGGVATGISGLLIAAQAYFMIREQEKSAAYANEAIKKAAAAMAANDPAGYPTWRSCLMIKAAILVGKKKRKEAIVLYESMAQEATGRGDAFFVMEGYRLSGHLHYECGQLNTAFETLLLAIAGGSYLEQDVRRQSTFLHAAGLAMHIGEKVRDAQDLGILRETLQSLLGDDWEALLQSDDMQKVTVKRKRSFFEFS